MVGVLEVAVELDHVLVGETIMDPELLRQLIDHPILLYGRLEDLLEGIQGSTGLVSALDHVAEFPGA